MYDIIGDIHGNCSKLKALLKKMDYRNENAAWRHAQRKAIFVGDYIDRGPQIRETLELVRNMVEAGSAIALMGNHEYNAVAYARKLDDGIFLRSHNKKHTKQHQATLDQFEDHADEWKSYIKWFYTLPLFLDLKDLRVVHACWDDDHIEWLKSRNYFALNDELLLDSHKKKSPAYKVINDTLKGKEFLIPQEYVWKDKDGHPRTANRIKWWIDPQSANHEEFLFNCPEKLKVKKAPKDLKVNIYSADAPPVFFGHYWLEDPYPVIQASNVICLDYSVAKEGYLVAYRWNGEDSIDKKHFVVVKD
jgi:Calcineurin-like phosphoesterase